MQHPWFTETYAANINSANWVFFPFFFSSFIVLLSYEIFYHDCLPCLLLSVLLFPAPLIHLYNISSVTITAEHILLWWYQSFRSVAFGLSKTAAQPQTLVLLEVAVDIKTLKLSKAAVSPPCCVVCVCVCFELCRSSHSVSVAGLIASSRHYSCTKTLFRYRPEANINTCKVCVSATEGCTNAKTYTTYCRVHTADSLPYK